MTRVNPTDLQMKLHAELARIVEAVWDELETEIRWE
jgi:hypothetical protein